MADIEATGNNSKNSGKSLKEKLLAVQLSLALVAGGAALAGCNNAGAATENDSDTSNTPIEQPASETPVVEPANPPEGTNGMGGGPPPTAETNQPNAETNNDNPLDGQHFEKYFQAEDAIREYYSSLLGADQFTFRSTGTTYRTIMIIKIEGGVRVAEYRYTYDDSDRANATSSAGTLTLIEE